MAAGVHDVNVKAVNVATPFTIVAVVPVIEDVDVAVITTALLVRSGFAQKSRIWTVNEAMATLCVTVVDWPAVVKNPEEPKAIWSFADDMRVTSPVTMVLPWARVAPSFPAVKVRYAVPEMHPLNPKDENVATPLDTMAVFPVSVDWLAVTVITTALLVASGCVAESIRWTLKEGYVP